MELRILSAEDVRAAIDMPAAIEAMRDAFVQLSSGRARVALRLPFESDHGVTLLMPAYLPENGALGAKVVSVFGGNPARGLPSIHALVLMLDAETGVPRAILDGTYLTALRTGAASGLATSLLAREDAGVVALFGTGAQAGLQLEALRAVRPVREVRVVSRSIEGARRFAAGIQGVDARAMADADAALRGADLVIAATNSATPVFDGAVVEPGTHVNGIGSYKPEMQEVDATFIQRALVVVDSREHALAETGDLIVPIAEGRYAADRIHAELGEIAAGTRPGRTSADQITFFKSVGNAAQDMAVAARVLRVAEETGLGTVVGI